MATAGKGADLEPGGLEPMEAKRAEALPEGPAWQFEPKWDGFRCLAFRRGPEVELQAKSGKPLGRYFPDVVELLAGLPAERFVLDGELAIPVGGTLSFDALQARLHPAESRVRKLAAETPAMLILFDLLEAPDGGSLLDRPLSARRAALERFHRGLPNRKALRERLPLSPATARRREAEAWLAGSGGALDGVVAKQLDQPYRCGERTMVKVKRLRSADCVVGGFRYGREGGGKSRQVGSLLLGLHDGEGRLHHVGFTSTIRDAERAALTKRLEALAEPPGFTGRAPGGPSRWSTERSAEWQPLRPELVVEVRYDQVSGQGSEARFRHGTKLLRWRPDKAPGQCGFEQLEPPLDPHRLAASQESGR